MACDICGNNTKPLAELREIYQTEAVKQVCPDCNKVLDKELSRIQTATANIQIGWFKNLIQMMVKL